MKSCPLTLIPLRLIYTQTLYVSHITLKDRRIEHSTLHRISSISKGEKLKKAFKKKKEGNKKGRYLQWKRGGEYGLSFE